MTGTLITVAPTGAESSKAAVPALPVKIDELVATAKECEALGAAIIHVHIRDDARGLDGHAQPPQLFGRFPGEPMPEGGEDLVAAVDEHDLCRGGVDAAEVALQTEAGQLRDLTGDLDAGRTAADHHEPEPRVSGVGIHLVLGHLEGAEDAAP